VSWTVRQRALEELAAAVVGQRANGAAIEVEHVKADERRGMARGER
jgi:hypothetical protein